MRSWVSARPPEKVGRDPDTQDRMDQQDVPKDRHSGLMKDERVLFSYCVPFGKFS
jgi:hypothetical protein